MKKIIIFLFLAIKIFSKSVEILCFEYPPLQGVSSFSSIGLAPEVIKAAFEENNVKTEFKFLPTQRAIEEIKKGTSLGMVGLAEYFDKDTSKNLTIYPINHMEFLIFYKKSSIKNFSYLNDNDLKKYTIGVLLNGITYTHANEIKLKVEGVINLEALFKKIDTNRTDIGISEYLSGLNTINQLFPNEKNQWVAYKEKSFFSTTGVLIFNKNNKNFVIYEPLFKDGLIKIMENGKYEKIVKKYYPNNEIDSNTKKLMKDFVRENKK